jgi:prepilin-type N-terminal cleavage/methylation domain-containing protein
VKATRRRSAGGFSLLELLAALAVGSVVLAAVAGLIRNVGLSFEAGTRGVGHAERLLSALERIATDLASVRYVHKTTEQGAKAIFEGRPNGIVFVSGAGVASAAPAEEIVVLEVEASGEATRPGDPPRGQSPALVPVFRSHAHLDADLVG